MRLFFIGLLSLVLAGMLTGCSAGRKLSDDQYLLRRSSIKLKTEVGVSEKSILSDQLGMIKLQKPNRYFLDIFPYKVWLYNFRYKKYEKDSANFQVTNKIVEKPVVYDSLLSTKTVNNMYSFLNNQGFYYAEVKDSVYFRRKKAFVRYNINTHYPYYIDSVSYSSISEPIKELIPAMQKNSMLTRDKVFSNSLAGEERNRLVNVMRNNGFYKFTVDNIAFELDTSIGVHYEARQKINLDYLLSQDESDFPKHRLNVQTIIRPSTDSQAFQRFSINRVIVFPDYADSLSFNSPVYQNDTLNEVEFRILKKYVNKGVLDKKIFIRPGFNYVQEDYLKTLRYLNDLGIFQYVRIYLVAPPNEPNSRKLDCYIIMSPTDKYNFQTNVEVSGGDLYVIGTAANVSITDNNFLKGANQLTASLSYGLELGQNKSEDLPFFKQFYLFSRNTGLNFRFTFPKFLLPVNQNRFSRSAVPSTIIDAGVSNLKRINYFSLRSINGSFGYVWKESAAKTWNVRPVFLNILHLSQIGPSFQARMDTIPAIRNSYQETFVEGEEVEFIYNTEGIKPQRHIYLKLGLEESGAIIGGIKKLSSLTGAEISLKNANYFRLNFDTRQYVIRPQSSLILRFSGGLGVPYAKSTVLPYLKQYYVGGAYSIRGWRPRILGPGSYLAMSNNPDDYLFIDQSGDIKLEWNAEYRFKLITLFSGAIAINGAFFGDAGNIWLARKDDKLPGAEFQFDKLYQDIAISTGAGLRFDLGGLLVVRLDWAFPLKMPYILQNNGWVTDDINLASREWRRKNINLNLAIGYPF